MSPTPPPKIAMTDILHGSFKGNIKSSFYNSQGDKTPSGHKNLLCAFSPIKPQSRDRRDRQLEKLKIWRTMQKKGSPRLPTFLECYFFFFFSTSHVCSG